MPTMLAFYLYVSMIINAYYYTYKKTRKSTTESIISYLAEQ